jgi:hypothetical protein
MSSGLYEDSSGKFGAMLDKMPSIDLLTIAVLGFDAYILYTQLDYYNRDSLFTVSTEPHILALQFTVVLILVYVVEFIHDRKKSDRH